MSSIDRIADVWGARTRLRDRELVQIAEDANRTTSRQLTWLNTRMKAAAPQALLASP